LLLIFNAILVCLNTAITSILLCLLAVLKLLFPFKSIQASLNQLSHRFMDVWAWFNHQLIDLTSEPTWDIQGGERLNKNGWYLLIANHLSWTDIVVIYSVFRRRIPLAKFFLKQELRYVPFLGVACWALDMPFMKRYSRRYLLKHPHKRGEDLATTRKSCARFRETPTTVVNFVEGTRYSEQKRVKSNSSYVHLLAPKTGGIAYTLGAMGEQFDAVINLTLAYPQNGSSPFRDLLSGRMKKIVVRIHVLPIDESLRGDYLNDKGFKRQFHQWLNGLWQEKDQELELIYQSEKVTAEKTTEQNNLKEKSTV
jgi:1-acyl-sn-glycerol-3-phosphate acyltransferase